LAHDASELPITNTIHETLGIRVVDASPDRVVLEMDVGPQVHQPFGLLHGGASAVIAESAASMAAFLNCKEGEFSVGTDLNVSHLRPKQDGKVVATATPVRKGRSLHVWSIDIEDENGRMIAIARCTVAIRKTGEQGAG
jgi:uncharacterized protein (TIGR00369 family)